MYKQFAMKGNARIQNDGRSHWFVHEACQQSTSQIGTILLDCLKPLKISHLSQRFKLGFLHEICHVMPRP